MDRYVKDVSKTEYSEKEVNDLTWQEKIELVQKDPVTCLRYFDHRVQEFLNTVLKSASDPIGKVKISFIELNFNSVVLLIFTCLFG